jgi:hypothetical protein
MLSAKKDFDSVSRTTLRPLTNNSMGSHDIIHKLQPFVIPRVSAIANMGWCERAAYNISFFGAETNNSQGSGEIGSAMHRVVIKSVLQIVESIKNRVNVSRQEALEVFLTNAREEVEINWKLYVLAGIDRPLPLIMQDLNIRAGRLATQLTAGSTSTTLAGDNDNHDDNYLKLLLRPEFTIRNPEIPLEGRLDLLKIRLTELPEGIIDSRYVRAEDLVDLAEKIEEIEIVQIKMGKAKPRSPRIYLQADAEALLLMHSLKLTKPPRYTWQFADKDVEHRKFNFAKVYQALDKYIRLYNAEESPAITGYCPTCPLKDPCQGWYFARSDNLSPEDLNRRRAAFRLSKTIRQDIADTDRWKVYVAFRDAKDRHEDGWAIIGLKVDKDSINPSSQELVLVSEHKAEGSRSSFGNFIDFSLGDFVTISDGNPNLGSNPTAIITGIDLKRESIKLQFFRNDHYFLTYDNRYNSPLTMDRFGFDTGLTTIRYLDDFFRESPYADIILRERAGSVMP